MTNPSLTPDIKVNEQTDVEDIRPGGKMLSIKESQANIEINLGKSTQLGSIKFVKPDESNIKTFTVLLVKIDGESPEPYLGGKVWVYSISIM